MDFGAGTPDATGGKGNRNDAEFRTWRKASMKKHFNSAGLLRWSGICSLAVFTLHLAGQMAAAPTTAAPPTKPRPVKLAISATARNAGDGRTVAVEVALRG